MALPGCKCRKGSFISGKKRTMAGSRKTRALFSWQRTFLKSKKCSLHRLPHFQISRFFRSAIQQISWCLSKVCFQFLTLTDFKRRDSPVFFTNLCEQMCSAFVFTWQASPVKLKAEVSIAVLRQNGRHELSCMLCPDHFLSHHWNSFSQRKESVFCVKVMLRKHYFCSEKATMQWKIETNFLQQTFAMNSAVTGDDSIVIPARSYTWAPNGSHSGNRTDIGTAPMPSKFRGWLFISFGSVALLVRVQGQYFAQLNLRTPFNLLVVSQTPARALAFLLYHDQRVLVNSQRLRHHYGNGVIY